MPSIYTDLLRLEKQANGENENTWGDKVNKVFDLIEDAIAGRAEITHDDESDYTLSTANSDDDEARNMVLSIGGTLTADRDVIVPAKSKLYFAENVTTGGHAVTLKTSGGTGVTIPNGVRTFVLCDGTDVVPAIDWLPELTVAGGIEIEGQATFTEVVATTSVGFAADAESSADVLLVREAANVLAQRNAANPQTFRLYNSYTDGSNYERFEMRWSSNVLELATKKDGSGSARAMSIGPDDSAALNLRTSGTSRWTVNADGHLIGAADNTYDIGASGDNRPRSIYVGTSIFVPNTGLKLADTDASHHLTIKPGSDLTSDRTLTINTGDAARTLDISAANVTFSEFGAFFVGAPDAEAALQALGFDPDSGVHFPLAAPVDEGTYDPDEFPYSFAGYPKIGLFLTVDGSYTNLTLRNSTPDEAGDGGGLELYSANANTSGSGGMIQILAGDDAGDGAETWGGQVYIEGGDSGAGLAGDVYLVGGASDSGTGGSIYLQGGSSTSGTAGSVYIKPGDSGSGASGDVVVSTDNGVERFRIVGDSGEWQLAGDEGEAGQVLTSNGSGSAPTWETILETLAIACSDETTPLEEGAGVVTFHIPYDFKLQEVIAGLSVAQDDGDAITIDVNVNGTTIFSTPLTIDNDEDTSITAATPAVLSTTTLSKGDKITVDIDQVGEETTAAGLKIYLVGSRT